MAKRERRLALPAYARAAWQRVAAGRPGGRHRSAGHPSASEAVTSPPAVEMAAEHERPDPRRAASVDDLGDPTFGRDDAERHRSPGDRRRSDRMPRWLPRAFLLAMLTVSAFFLAWWLLGRLRDLIGLLLLAQFLAFALEPAVNWLARRGWRRGAATGVTMLVVLASLIGFMVAVGSLLVSQVTTLSARFPQYLELTIEWVNSTFDTNISIQQIQNQVTANDGPLRRWAEGVASNAVDLSTSVFGVIFQTLTVILFGYYLCADAPRVRRSLCSVLPPARQRDVMRAWEIAVDKTGGYLYSRLLLALVSSLAHYIVLTLLGVPYAVALALWVGLVSQLIPTVGTYLAAAMPLIVALVSHPVDALFLLVFVVIYQQVENYLLQPKITARTLDLHPAVAFGAVLAGAAVLGPIGAILAIPFTAISQTFVGSYIRRYEVEEHPIHEPVAKGPIESPPPMPPRHGDDAPHHADGSLAAPASPEETPVEELTPEAAPAPVSPPRPAGTSSATT
ncbi:AI-2E family transporter [Cryptosporangium aurantiacum]|uniref:Predicted PurR-regulated permease PerM n=1 Tax=Cryptosporangium aurantiacum TaxID=134849 RepID=A0A1M7MW11_9ACTN|nr:AI-2E family transporter [Cryptosporangium aurantiacum]SHM95362.1 Predicted PurR-regulated permease PerM [Cryptosporangium aurantiacum]